MNIGFIGLGKLGLPCAEEFSRHFDTYGYDVANIESDLVAVKWTRSIEELTKSSEVVFIAVQTPHDENYDGSKPTSELEVKDFDYSYVQNVLTELSGFDLEDKTIVLISTVLPGTIRNTLKAPKKIQERLIYNPYLIAMGTEVEDLINPEMLIVGNMSGKRDHHIERLENIYKKIINKDFKKMFGTWEEAESTKIFYNTFISTKISLVNMIQDVAMKIGNINCDKVTDALSESSMRIISPMYMKAGMGDGGPCHPRDNIALSSLAKRLELGYDLFGSIMHSREQQAKNLACFVFSHGKKICILGESFKPNSKIKTGSSSLLVAYYLKELGAEVCFDKHDEKSDHNTFLVAHRGCFYDYTFPENSIIIDPWREFPDIENSKVIHYGNTTNVL